MSGTDNFLVTQRRRAKPICTNFLIVAALIGLLLTVAAPTSAADASDEAAVPFFIDEDVVTEFVDIDLDEVPYQDQAMVDYDLYTTNAGTAATSTTTQPPPSIVINSNKAGFFRRTIPSSGSKCSPLLILHVRSR